MIDKKNNSKLHDSPGPVPPPLPRAVASPSGSTLPPLASSHARYSQDGAGRLNEYAATFPSNSKGPEFVDESLDKSSDPKSNWLGKVFWQIPSWLTSAVLHVAIVLVLALIPVKDEISNTLSLILGMSDSAGVEDALDSFDLNAMSMELDPTEEPGEDLAMVVTDLETSVTDLSDLTADIAKVPMTIQAGLSSRKGLMKDAMLKAYGGTAETERAVAMGLEWLKKHQANDGSWGLSGPYGEGGVNENRPAATAMALMAFMGAGNTHREGAYQSNVARGLEFLLSIQDEDGFFAAKATGIQRTYSQAQASIAVCELFGMTGDESLRIHAERAVRWAIDAQSDAGGWRYQPRQDSDTSVTGWYVMALISARMAGLEVDSQSLENVHLFLDSVQRSAGENRPNDQGDRYAYSLGGKDKDSMTAEGMLCRMYLGWKTSDPRIVRGCEYLASKPISSELSQRDYYYWYYATNSLHHAGGAPWFRWNQAMREVLPAMQIQGGRERGSWPPQGDPHGDAGGRLYSTVMAILCLEAYYRHMPLSEMANQH